MYSTKLPILPFQSVLGLLSGVSLGIGFQEARQIIPNFDAYSNQGLWIISIILILLFMIPLHFVINGHFGTLQNDAERAELYAGPPQAWKIGLARILFWICGGVGLVLGLSPNNLFFGPF